MGVKIVSEDPIVEDFAIMAVSVVLSIVVRDAWRSNDAPATTAGAVPIGAFQLRMKRQRVSFDEILLSDSSNSDQCLTQDMTPFEKTICDMHTSY